MPIDTAVAAMTSEMASATVAISSTPACRRLKNFCSVIGDAKPTLPVSSAMVVILRESVGRISPDESGLANQYCLVAISPWIPAPVRPDFGEAIDEERRFRDFG